MNEILERIPRDVYNRVWSWGRLTVLPKYYKPRTKSSRLVTFLITGPYRMTRLSFVALTSLLDSPYLAVALCCVSLATSFCLSVCLSLCMRSIKTKTSRQEPFLSIRCRPLQQSQGLTLTLTHLFPSTTFLHIAQATLSHGTVALF